MDGNVAIRMFPDDVAFGVVAIKNLALVLCHLKGHGKASFHFCGARRHTTPALCLEASHGSHWQQNIGLAR